MVKPRNGCKDNWNAFMCKGAHFTKFDIPVCPTTVKSLPKKILTWEEAKQVHKKLVRENNEYYSDAFICFYIDDYKFDGVPIFLCIKIFLSHSKSGTYTE